MTNSNWITGGKVFQKCFDKKDDVVAAEIHITAKGVYEAFLNGKRVGDFILAPGFTSYNKHHQYQVYDITEMLNESNELTVFVGDGWYKGRLAWVSQSGWITQPNLYGDTAAIIAKLKLTFANGTQVIVTDESWMCGDSPILFDSIYDGETYDARIVPEFKRNATVLDAPKDMLVLQASEHVTEHERISPVAFITTPKGERVVDFGQNLSGYVEFSLTAKAGEKVIISHAEVLDRDGNFYTENYKSAKARIEYTCKDGQQTYKPHFTFMGFRYIRLDACPSDAEFTAIAVHTNMKRTGFFESSNEMLNKLYNNTIWSQKGNFVDYPTDCPQRDERLGWTGDVQIFAKAASYNFDANKFFTKWLVDVRADQREHGGIPSVIPDIMNGNEFSAAWGDVCVTCPWQLYLTYGNKDVLESQFKCMEKWLDFSKSDDGFQFGDWLALDAEEGSYKGATDEEFVKAAFHAYSTMLFIKAGKVLGKDMSVVEARYVLEVADFQNKYDGKYSTQTEHVLALQFDLTTDRKGTAAALADMIIANDYKLKTGFVGTPYLLHVLSDNGYADIAYALLLQTDYPSWLYPITKGATTIWEHWDGIKPDGSFWSVDMNSFNHYAFGSVVDWLYEVAAGIKIDENAPGFERVLIKPTPDKRLSHLGASIDTKYGVVSSKWHIFDNTTVYEIETPSPAVIVIAGEEYNVGKGCYKYEVRG